MAAKFVLKKGSTGKFRFNLVASDRSQRELPEQGQCHQRHRVGQRNAPNAEIDDQTGLFATKRGGAHSRR